MSNRRIVEAACLAALMPFAANCFARKKKPPLNLGNNREVFTASISPSKYGGGLQTKDFSSDPDARVIIEVDSYSAEGESQGFAKAFSEGGAESLYRALSDVDKGYLEYEAGGPRLPLAIVQSALARGTQTLDIIAVATVPYLASGGYGVLQMGAAKEDGYPYTFIQLKVNKQGTGEGLLYEHAALTFDQQGRMHLKPMSQFPAKLIGVRQEKQRRKKVGMKGKRSSGGFLKIPRRDFLFTAAGASAAGLLIPPFLSPGTPQDSPPS